MPVLFRFTGSTVMNIDHHPIMSQRISGWIQFFEVTSIFVCWIFLFISFPCLVRIAFVSASLLIWSPIILFVHFSWVFLAIIWSTCLWSVVVSVARLSSLEEISPVGTILFALLYSVYPALSFWVILRLSYSSAKNFLKPIHVFHLQVFYPFIAGIKIDSIC